MIVKMYNGIKVDNCFYFVCYDMNLLCCWHIKKREMAIIGSAPEEHLFKEGLFGNILYSDHKLILIPFNARNLWLYELKKENWIKIDIPKTDYNEHKFYGGMVREHSLYMLGYNYPAVLKVDLMTGNIKTLNFDKSILEKDYLSDGLLNWNYSIHDGFLITPVLCANQILKLNLANDEMEYISIKGSISNCVGIAWDGERYWLPPRVGNKYLLWDGNQSFKEYDLPKQVECIQPYFGGAYAVSNKIIFTSFIGNSIKRQADENACWEIMDQTFIFGKSISLNELLLGNIDGEIWWISDDGDQIISCDIKLEDYKKFLKSESKKNRSEFIDTVMKEQALFSLNNFINLI